MPLFFAIKPGEKYLERMAEWWGSIQWCGAGEAEASEGIKVRATEWSEDGYLRVALGTRLSFWQENKILSVTTSLYFD